MTPANLELKEKCLSHWYALFQVRDPLMSEHEPVASQCAFCKVYAHDEECAGCPIRERTGKSCCIDTPFSDVYAAWCQWRADLRRFPGNEPLMKSRRKMYQQWVQDMINFLESL